MLTTRSRYVCKSTFGLSLTRSRTDPYPHLCWLWQRRPVVDDSRRFAKALKKRGLDHEYVEYENAIHAFQAFFWQSQAKQFWRDQGQFVRRFMDDLVVE